MKHLLRAMGATALLGLGACSNGQFSALEGSAATGNPTPTDTIFACMNHALADKPHIKIAMGKVQDLTGKYSYEAAQGGYAITQGGSLLGSTALSKIKLVDQLERSDIAIGEMEMNMAAKDITSYVDRNGQAQLARNLKGIVPATDFYIYGGITELNYNLQSGGAELALNGVGGGGRYFVMNVAADLKLVDAHTLRVVAVANTQKRLVGYEVKANIFRFFPGQLVDFNTGAAFQEPVQLGVRQTVEQAIIELVAVPYRWDWRTCDHRGGQQEAANKNSPAPSAAAANREEPTS